ncbi:MAG: hypothetical protein QXG97_00875, partial [Nitrososphaerota archaeon]
DAAIFSRDCNIHRMRQTPLDSNRLCEQMFTCAIRIQLKTTRDHDFLVFTNHLRRSSECLRLSYRPD